MGTKLVLALETAPIMHQPSSVAVSGLGVGVGPSDIHQTIGPSDIHQIIGVAREAQHSQRNIRLRRVPANEQLGAGLVISLESAPVMHQPLSVAASGLGASAGPSNTHQTISEVGEAQHSQRTVNHQDFLPTNLATWTIRNSHPQLPAQLAIHLSFDCVPKTSSVTAIVQPTPPMQQPIPVSYFLERLTIQAAIQNSVHLEVPVSSLTTTQIISGLLYEEIEELEELMIEYRRGLAGAVIEAHMKRQQYEANVVGSPLKDEKCCICQENYADGEDLGKLDCGHYFHFDSIKQWLIQKNNYPISKRKALQV
ncbi:hypothetical protein GH714_030740 [Hevea brasiliensis]|uniref:RING-type E3 ubiquitin transferase n=1 Tax=Hevea brasiliensis TaxID=3981 RepID=A0A6A6LWI3_HEVBR|nr:hypothetical protein GH714_030740 [Hevea brasiliensis]